MTKAGKPDETGAKRDNVLRRVAANIRKRPDVSGLVDDLVGQLRTWRFKSTVCEPPGASRGIRGDNTNEIVAELLRRRGTLPQLPPPSGSVHAAPDSAASGEREDGGDSGVMSTPPPAAATASAVDGNGGSGAAPPDDVLRARLAEAERRCAEFERRCEEERRGRVEERRRREEAEARERELRRRRASEDRPQERAVRRRRGTAAPPPNAIVAGVSPDGNEYDDTTDLPPELLPSAHADADDQDGDDAQQDNNANQLSAAVPQDPPNIGGNDVTAVRDAADAVLETVITRNGRQEATRSSVHFTRDQIVEAYVFRGFVFMRALEQSDKTMCIFVLALMCARLGRPCLILAALNKAEVAALAGKMDDADSTLRTVFGLDVMFCDNGSGAYEKLCCDNGSSRKIDEARLNRQKFRHGKLAVVMPAYAAPKANAFLARVQASNVLLVVDESDEMVGDISVPAGTKERAFVDVVGRPHVAGARTTGAVLVSATHVADAHFWHCVRPEVPLLPIFIDTNALRQKGFTTEDDMRLFATVSADQDGGDKHKFGLMSRSFKALVIDFKEAPIRRKLMMIASSPYVKADERTTLQAQAEYILDPANALDPEAVVLVFSPNKCHAVYRDDHGDDPVTRPVVDERGHMVKEPSKALTILQRHFCRFGVDRRFIAVGYSAFQRSASVRTRNMVMTHMFVMLTRGKDVAAVRQTLLRCGGRNTAVIRRYNCRVGGGSEDQAYVRVVTTPNDWWLTKTLNGFNAWFLNMRIDGVDDIYRAHMPTECLAMRRTLHPWTPRPKKTQFDRMQRMGVAGTAEQQDQVKRAHRAEVTSANASAATLVARHDDGVTSRREQARGVGDEGGAALPPVAHGRAPSPPPLPAPPAVTAVHPDDVPTTSRGIGADDVRGFINDGDPGHWDDGVDSSEEDDTGCAPLLNTNTQVPCGDRQRSEPTAADRVLLTLMSMNVPSTTQHDVIRIMRSGGYDIADMNRVPFQRLRQKGFTSGYGGSLAITQMGRDYIMNKFNV